MMEQLLMPIFCRVIRKYGCGILLLAASFSCVNESILVEPDTNPKAQILFSVQVPVMDHPLTRGLEGQRENEVRTLDVLLFEGSQWTRVAATGISSGNNGVSTFKLIMDAGTYDHILVLANATGMLASLPAGAASRDDVQKALIMNLTEKWSTDPAEPGYSPIPMWGELDNVTITSSTTQLGTTIDLRRMLARVNVSVTADNFELKEVRVYHPCLQGLLIPNPASMNAGQVFRESWLTGWSRSDAVWIYDGVQDNALIREIYIPEVPAGDPDDITQNTFLILAGIFDDGKEEITYYRIDFADYVSEAGEILEIDDPYELEYFPILRNYSYDITVTHAICAGDTSAEAAAAKPPENLRARVMMRNEFYYNYFLYDKHDYLSLQASYLPIYFNDDEIRIGVDTNLGGKEVIEAKISLSETDPDQQPELAFLSIEDGTPYEFSKANTYFTPMAEIRVYTLPLVEQDITRKFYIHVRAGQFSTVITVEHQAPFSAIDAPDTATGYFEFTEEQSANCYMRKGGNILIDRTRMERGPFMIPVYPQPALAMSADTPAEIRLPSNWLTLTEPTSSWAAQILWCDKPLDWTDLEVRDQRVFRAAALWGDKKMQTIGSGTHQILISHVQPTSDTGTGANAVVILFEDKNGDGIYDPAQDIIRWSWHLWSGEGYFLAPNTSRRTIGFINSEAKTAINLYVNVLANFNYQVDEDISSGGYLYKHHTGRRICNVFTDRNLGALDVIRGNGVGATAVGQTAYLNWNQKNHAQGLQYQWGRKDPFPEILEGNVFKKIYYWNNYESGNTIQTYSKSGEQSLLEYSIQHPLTFITGASSPTGDWFSATGLVADELWNGNLLQRGVTKSAYDPCPYPYRVTFGAPSVESSWQDYNPWSMTFINASNHIDTPVKGSISQFRNTLATAATNYAYNAVESASGAGYHFSHIGGSSAAQRVYSAITMGFYPLPGYIDADGNIKGHGQYGVYATATANLDSPGTSTSMWMTPTSNLFEDDINTTVPTPRAQSQSVRCVMDVTLTQYNIFVVP